MKDNVIDFIAQTLDVKKEEVKEDMSLSDALGVDSTEMVELNIALGKKFGITINQGEITNKDTPLQIVEKIKKKSG